MSERARKTKTKHNIIRYSRACGAEPDEVDDVVISGSLFRMEQMSDTHFWLAIYRGEERVAFGIVWDKKRKRLIGYVQEDELCCQDDMQCLAAEEGAR